VFHPQKSGEFGFEGCSLLSEGEPKFESCPYGGLDFIGIEHSTRVGNGGFAWDEREWVLGSWEVSLMGGQRKFTSEAEDFSSNLIRRSRHWRKMRMWIFLAVVVAGLGA
jgi:hypothetical protein